MPELSRLMLPWQCGKEQRCLGGRAGQQHTERALHHSWQLSPWPIKGLHYPAEHIKSLVNAGFGMQVCILAYQGTWLPTGNSYVMVSCWTKATAGDE